MWHEIQKNKTGLPAKQRLRAIYHQELCLCFLFRHQTLWHRVNVEEGEATGGSQPIWVDLLRQPVAPSGLALVSW